MPLRRAIPVILVVIAVALAACGGGSDESGPMGEGRGVYGDLCSTCHGDSGQGGTGPALTDVAVVFPSCADHIEWVRLGSTGWLETNGGTYGATGKPVEGGMPAVEEIYSPQEIASVVVFERVEYGGLPLEEVAADCGVTLPPPTE